MNNPDEFQSRVRFNRPTLSEQRPLGFILNDEDKTRFCSTFEGSNGAIIFSSRCFHSVPESYHDLALRVKQSDQSRIQAGLVRHCCAWVRVDTRYFGVSNVAYAVLGGETERNFQKFVTYLSDLVGSLEQHFILCKKFSGETFLHNTSLSLSSESLIPTYAWSPGEVNKALLRFVKLNQIIFDPSNVTEYQTYVDGQLTSKEPKLWAGTIL